MAVQAWGPHSKFGLIAPVVQQARPRNPILTDAVRVADQPREQLGDTGGDGRLNQSSMSQALQMAIAKSQ